MIQVVGGIFLLIGVLIIACVKQQIPSFPGFKAEVKGSFYVLCTGDVSIIFP